MQEIGNSGFVMRHLWMFFYLASRLIENFLVKQFFKLLFETQPTYVS